jgi:transcription elongation factor Elf1
VREPPDLPDDYTCPRCGEPQVVVELRQEQIALACRTCEYVVTRRPTDREI